MPADPPKRLIMLSTRPSAPQIWTSVQFRVVSVEVLRAAESVEAVERRSP